MKQNIIWFIYVKRQSISTKPGVNISQFTIYSGFKSQKVFSFIKQVGIICKKVKVKNTRAFTEVIYV